MDEARVDAWGVGEQGGNFQEKEKYFVNICTPACGLKNVLFLLKILST